jgi:hypothetical protein
MRLLKSLCVATTLTLGLSSFANAAVVGVSEIRVGLNTAHSSTLQINEIIATTVGSGLDAALASAGATVTSSPPLGANLGASNTIDGLATASSGYYHGPFNPTDFVSVTLAAPTDLASLTIVGRTNGCCTNRDSYIFELFDINGALLFTEALDARGVGLGGVTSQLQPPNAVPLPAALPLLLLSLGTLGAFRGYRKG